MFAGGLIFNASPPAQFHSRGGLLGEASPCCRQQGAHPRAAPAALTSSFWYAVTAMNCVSGKQWLVIMRCAPPTLTMWIRGSYLCKEFSMI